MGKGPLPYTHMSTLKPKPGRVTTVENHTDHNADVCSDVTGCNKTMIVLQNIATGINYPENVKTGH